MSKPTRVWSSGQAWYQYLCFVWCVGFGAYDYTHGYWFGAMLMMAVLVLNTVTLWSMINTQARMRRSEREMGQILAMRKGGSNGGS